MGYMDARNDVMYFQVFVECFELVVCAVAGFQTVNPSLSQ